MSDFLKFLLTPLLSNPEALSISETPSALYLQVAPDDTGRVIGKKGVIISALRTLLRTYCTLNKLPHTTLILKTDQP
ncbi:MAG: KH domain-containing protein [Patescibacteria group bacterium]